MSAGDRKLADAEALMSTRNRGTAAELAELFAFHKTKCDRCAGVDLGRPATLAYACLEGSRMLKDLAEAHHKLAAARHGGAS